MADTDCSPRRSKRLEKMEVDSDEAFTSLEILKSKLHTSETPEKLLCREKECEEIRNFIMNGIKRDSESQCLYISGVPGTGKTASVLKVGFIAFYNDFVVILHKKLANLYNYMTIFIYYIKCLY